MAEVAGSASAVDASNDPIAARIRVQAMCALGLTTGTEHSQEDVTAREQRVEHARGA